MLAGKPPPHTYFWEQFMNDNHLDPDAYGLNDENWGEEHKGIEKAMRELDTGRWQWDKITMCMTGKDADLEPWGYQGVELVSVGEDGVRVIVHGGKTFAGDDVCLNLPEEIESSEEWYDKAREAFLENAFEVVCGIGWPGEWTGDDWFITYTSDPVLVPWVLDEESAPDYAKTAAAIYAAAQEDIKPWEEAVYGASRTMEQLAGWRDMEGNRCPLGKPSKAAAWTTQEEYDDADL